MASLMEMSLEDIIRKKKGDRVRPKGNFKGKPPLKKIPIKNAPVMDARNKIISKKRTQITDARDKLAQLAKQRDARLKLEQLRMKRAALPQPRSLRQTQGKYGQAAAARNIPRERALINRERLFTDSSRQVVSQPLSRSRISGRQLTTSSRQLTTSSRQLTTSSRQHVAAAPRQLNTKRFLENRSIESTSMAMDSRPRVKPKPILRTVDNDLEMMDEDEDMLMRPTLTSLNRKANLQLRIVARNESVMRDTRSSARRLATPERESPPRPPSILKKRPMASLRLEKRLDKPALEYRIIVSNLRSTVTGGDIEELFGDVGGMMESRLVRPGTAEVIYKTLEDAQKAVDLYHNRQLDGQPMNCLLVTPRPTTAPARAIMYGSRAFKQSGSHLSSDGKVLVYGHLPRNGSKPSLIGSSSNVEPDISTFHKVLFSNF